ncbi:MAG: glucose-6-phosphate isomerase [Bacteroidales bacterium]|nr:glucose-6-phosphate isomerase [Bacteroidales bacterium]
MLKLDLAHIHPFISETDLSEAKEEVNNSLKTLHSKTGAGNDFLGWLDLPGSYDEGPLKEILNLAKNLKDKVDFIVVIGIGGSYLGTRAVSESSIGSFDYLVEKSEDPQIIYAGQNIGEDYLFELLDFLENRSYGLVVVSKSGTTTEPALAFRLLKEQLVNSVGPAEARERIIAITDSSKGALRKMVEQEGYASFVIPDDVGGRFSVLTPVGLIPLAISGIDIVSLLKGAEDMRQRTMGDVKVEENPAAMYAAARNALYNKGKFIEILVNYNPKLHYFSEWWKQLFGESEGKENKGIFPASVDLTTDLHSMGQYIQEGRRELFETVISIKNSKYKLLVPDDENNLDKLNYLAGKRVDEVNKMAELGTLMAHIDGGVPNIRIEVDTLDEYNMGQLIYFFEISCAISGYTLGINPFDQPGVEAYKKNMFALLGKPGFEAETERLNKLIK